MKLSESQALLDDDGELIKGKWELDQKHRVTYKSNADKEEAKFTAKIIDIKSGALVLGVTRKQKDQSYSAKKYQLKGRWHLDSKNRITFEVNRHKGLTNKLTFKNAWKVNRNAEIVYTYSQEQLKTKEKIAKKLLFKGHWDILEKNRLTYKLQKNNDSTFKVRGAFETKSIYAKKGQIRYQFGIELNKKVKKQTITLFGKWKYSRKLGLHFDMKYQNSVSRKIAFGGNFNFDERNKVTVDLTNQSGKHMGMELVLTRQFLRTDGEAFIRLFKSQSEAGIMVGYDFKW
jgi:hypothetical protein